MRSLRRSWLAAGFLALAACSPAARIRRHQALFATFPPEVQRELRRGRAEPGMTPAMVELALGKPDRVYRRKTAASEQEIWIYGQSEVSPGVDMIVLPGGYDSAWGDGVILGAGGSSRYEVRERVVFEGGKAVSVESRQR
ncbi:MAG: hypothetical protein KGO96_09790 [Elusimicrobia bacterium]|nr:hypothetical protein [Elusimicrobiota bacterium]MDE2426180.1 hypothetical protein [Elusimicrobiota bacterium]